METTPVKNQKGIKKFWAKFKALLKSKPSSATSPTTMPNSSANVTSKPSQQAPSSVVNPNPAVRDEPQVKKPESDPLPPPSSIPSQPTQEPTAVNSQPKWDALQFSGDNDLIEVDNDDSVDPSFSLPDEHHPSSTNDTDPAAYVALKAQDIYSRYGLKVEPVELKLKSKTQIERVEKRPRIRVRWTCHECKSTFGREKICSTCTHSRCTSCVRYPVKRPGDKAKKMPAKTMPVPPPTTQQPTTGACHECKTTFDIPAAECDNCHHQICERCLKESLEEATLPSSIAIAA